MTSVQAELSSTRLAHELKSSLDTQDTAPSEVTSDSAFTEISERLGGRFAADLAAILRSASEGSAAEPQTYASPDRVDPDAHAYRQFALDCLQAGRVQNAVALIQRHAPDQMVWLEKQIRGSTSQVKNLTDLPPSKNAYEFLSTIGIVPDRVKVNPEAGRIAYALKQFGLYRAWAYAHAADEGDGWIERMELETLWRNVGIARSPRHARRFIKEGVNKGYWTQDRTRKRIYLTGQVRVATQLVRIAMETDEAIVGTNLPGRRRIAVNLAGSLQEASARLYAAWFVSKDTRHRGTIISRETLCQLWRVSVPTLLTWERIARIMRQANYAQSNDTAIDRVPAHAYLTLNRNGSYAATWRLPNTYIVKHQAIQRHSSAGKATKIREAVKAEIAQAEQRGSIGDTASLSSGKRYFVPDVRSRTTAFRACDNYLRKLGRCDGDLSERRYFSIGERYGVRVFEAYDLHNGVCETNIHQRLIWQERQQEFVAVKESFRNLIASCLP